MKETGNILFWFRQDLRLLDNPALYHAYQAALDNIANNTSTKVFLVYILDDSNSAEHQMGGASRWWLHHSLTSLNKRLDKKLSVYHGDPLSLIPKIVKNNQITAVYYNRCYEPWRIACDTKLKASLKKQDIAVQSYNGSLLWEPWDVSKADGTQYKVFTPFYRKGCLGDTTIPPQQSYKSIETKKFSDVKLSKISDSLNVKQLDLLPHIAWDKDFYTVWSKNDLDTFGEQDALKRFEQFIKKGLATYKDGRNSPSNTHSISRLSPHLHFGEISPHTVWHKLAGKQDKNTEHFKSELGWREFSYSLLYHFPQLPKANWQPKFDKFPWIKLSSQKNKKLLQAWQKGLTGYPLVDAGMRELWQTGYMHNRVRMVTASFLVKNLLIHWHYGERWFWDCLVDADLANNSASWQWVAGCGADAAPYFRIFNPTTQGEKFDPEGVYTKQYVPELKNLPKKYLYKPWEAPVDILQQAGITLGVDYPKPIIDLASSRQEALLAYEKIKA